MFLLIFFIDIITPVISSTQIASDVMCVQFITPPPPDTSHWFSTQSSQYQNWKANTYSNLTVNEIGLPVLESSAGISNFYARTDSKHKFNKTEIENWLSIG